MSRILNSLFQGQLVHFGAFRCHPSHPSFTNTGPIRGGHLLVFPRTCVRITHEGREPVVASPNVVMFYNEGQIYERAPISERGDLCEWFAFSPPVIVDTLSNFDPDACEHPDQPFSLTHGPSDAGSYMLQRQAVEHFTASRWPNTLLIEELLLQVLFTVVQSSFQARGCGQRPTREDTRRAQENVVRAVQELIAARFQETLGLAEIATSVHSSPFRLCRIFRKQTGMTIHQYQEQIRLRSALDRIPDCRGDLTTLALDLGYSSHSHFTYAFRRTFGVAPSQLVAGPSSQQLRKLSKILIV